MLTNIFITLLSPALLCTESCNIEVDQKKKEAEKLEEEYKKQRSTVIKLMGEIKAKEEYLEEKRKELAKLNLTYINAKQQSVQTDLGEVSDDLKKLEQKIALIEKDIRKGEEEQAQLITRITKAEDQLNDTMERIEKCLESLKKQIEDLACEKSIKLYEYDRKVSRTQSHPQQGLWPETIHGTAAARELSVIEKLIMLRRGGLGRTAMMATGTSPRVAIAAAAITFAG